jgi:hypothetical protein
VAVLALCVPPIPLGDVAATAMAVMPQHKPNASIFFMEASLGEVKWKSSFVVTGDERGSAHYLFSGTQVLCHDSVTKLTNQDSSKKIHHPLHTN